METFSVFPFPIQNFLMESAIFFRLNLQLIFCSIEAYFIFFLLILSPFSFLLLCFLLSLISFTHQYHLSLSNTVSLSLFLFPFKTVSHFLYCILTFSVLLAAIFENSIWSMYQLISPFIYVFFCLCSLHLGCASSLSRVQLCETPWTVAHQTPLSLEFSRQEHWSGQPFPSAGDLPDPEIKLGSPAWQADSLPSEPPGKPQTYFLHMDIQLFQHHVLKRL